MTLDPKLAKKVERNGGADKIIECSWKGKPAALAFGVDRLLLLGVGFSTELGAPFGLAHILERDGLARRLKFYGMEETVTFADAGTARDFDETLGERNVDAEHVSATAAEAIPPARVATLHQLPGYRIVSVRGPVSELSATSGLTATMKGTSALESAMSQLRRTAAAMQANAIVGLTSSVFGAAGGITSAFGGDAVGVLLIGTAVVVEPMRDEPSSRESLSGEIAR
jgi:uncharacterized protein YbjQ (UPF0145 family)